MPIIYGLFDPRKPILLWEVRYIGQSVRTPQARLNQYLSDVFVDPDRSLNEWFIGLLAIGQPPALRVLEQPSLTNLNIRERAWVTEGRRQGWNLLNERKGGESHRGPRGPKPRDPVEAYWGYVVKGPEEDSCWGWSSTTDDFGYGIFYSSAGGERKRWAAHRFSWQLRNGPIPEGLCVLHRCDDPPCSNPDHLFLGTRAENMQDAAAKGRMRNGKEEQTHCQRGHPLSGDNIILYKGHRICRECRRIYEREVYLLEKEAEGLTVAPRNSDRTHCPQGHEYTTENTYTSKSGSRSCKLCSKERQRRAYREKKDKKTDGLNDPVVVEQRRERAKDLGETHGHANGIAVSQLMRQCLECDKISNAGGLAMHQKATHHTGWKNVTTIT